MSKYICVREAFDYIYLGDTKDKLSFSEYMNLQKYLEENINTKSSIIEHKYNKIKFVNFVGILKIGNVTIEILPKISLTNDKNSDRKVLLLMLSKCLEVDLNLDKFIESNTQNFNVLDLIVDKYLDLLLLELNKGILRGYKNHSDNLKTLKGKILLKEHISKNHSNKDRVFCSFDEYGDNILLNQIFKFANEKILKKLNNKNTINKCNKALLKLVNVEKKHIDEGIFPRVQINRENKRFLKAFELAKFIILNISNDSGIGLNSGFSMLFEINTLYEVYIGKVIKEIYSNKRVLTQDNSRYLLFNQNTNRKFFKLKPDVVIKDREKTIIIDTKWKAIEFNSKKIYRSSDIYQMYAYINSYPEAKKVVLLYPHLKENSEYPTWNLLNMPNKEIHIRTVRLDSFYNTAKDLREIIG